MEKIQLLSIKKDDNIISYSFAVSDGLKKYFSGKEFFIEYSENIENVPDSIAAIPFVANVLPIIWLTDSKLILPELDEDFYNCFPKLKNGYEQMFPESEFKGQIEAGQIVKHYLNNKVNKSAMFYSGGLDSVNTFISHAYEKPDLISIWGSDIRCDNKKGWDLVHSAIEYTAKCFNLPDIVFRSSFRAFDNESALNNDYRDQLKDDWWHGVKHGIALLSHVAPYAYLNNITVMYIASSNCPLDGHIRCASNPLTDNHVRFCGCKVVHDGFEFSRQDKVHNIVEFCRKNKIFFPLHVCWRSQTGGNCCKCEKCFRTMAGLIAEGANPQKFGFDDIIQIKKMKDTILGVEWKEDAIWKHWPHIQRALKENENLARKTPYWKYIKWIIGVDFLHIDSPRYSFSYRMKSFLFKLKRKTERVVSNFKRKYIKKRDKIGFRRLLKRDDYDCFMIGTPTHTNIGDSAISIAQTVYIESLGYQVKEIGFSEYKEYGTIINKRIAKSRKPVFLIGGGNMGNQWIDEEILRRNILKAVTKNKIVIFPQTIFYTPDTVGQTERVKSIDFYNDKKMLTIIAREQISFEIMKDLYPKTEVLLAPDIVLSANASVFGVKHYDREGVLFILREDPERAMSDDTRSILINNVEKMGINYRVSDMHSAKPVTKENRFGVVTEKMNEFAAAKLIITDRLHGMVFAAITATPCIVFGNYNQKVKGTYDWISYLPYIKYVNSAEEAEKFIPELMNLGTCKYDNFPLMPYFEKLKGVITKICRK